MFHYLEPQYLYLLLLLPLLLVGYWLVSLFARRRLQRWGNPQQIKSLVLHYSAHRGWVKTFLMMWALLCLVVALSQPQMPTTSVKTVTSVAEMAVMVDVSNSMLATDIAPNRLERAKEVVKQLIEVFPKDKISLGVFAGEAYPQLPMTTDHTAAMLFLEAFSPDMVTQQGTNLFAAIQAGKKTFTQPANGAKILLILTDGEDHQEKVEEIGDFEKEGIHLFFLGIGTQQGSFIPLSQERVEEELLLPTSQPMGQEQGAVQFLKDREGKVVVSSLQEQLLLGWAKSLHGKYLTMSDGGNSLLKLKELLEEIKTKEKASEGVTLMPLFPLVALLALALLVVEFLMSETRSTWLNGRKFFRSIFPTKS